LNTFGKVYRVFTEEVVMWSTDDSPFQANSSHALKVLQITKAGFRRIGCLKSRNLKHSTTWSKNLVL
jgi:hypothetical protein